MVNKPSICFVAPGAYPILAKDRQLKSAGGAEVQQTILAQTLASRGYRVSMVCLDHGQPDVCQISGITVWRAHSPIQGIPVIRFIHPRATSMWKAMVLADADIYYQQCAGVLTWLVWQFCKWHAKRSVFAAGSNLDFVPGRENIPNWRDRSLYRMAIRRVSDIIVQNPTQQQMCVDVYGRQAITIPNMYQENGTGTGTIGGPILWVGNMRRVKRPELYVELAKRLPQYHFVMIGGKSADGELYYEGIRQAAKQIPNLSFKGFVPYHEVGTFFDRASLLVCTSEAEGFPNTFLQAWLRGIPVVSLFDTGFRYRGIPVEHLAKNIDEASQIVLALRTSIDSWKMASEQARLHYQDAHSVMAICSQYDSLFMKKV